MKEFESDEYTSDEVSVSEDLETEKYLEDLEDLKDAVIPSDDAPPYERAYSIFLSEKPKFYINQYHEYFIVYDDFFLPYESFILTDSKFEHKMQNLYFEQYNEYLPTKDFKKFIDKIRTLAVAQSNSYCQPLRYSSKGLGNNLELYIDTCDSDHNIIKISNESVEMGRYETFFMKFSNQKMITYEDSNNIYDIFEFIPIAPNERLLFISYLTANLIDSINIPSLNLVCDDERTVSQSFKFIKDLLDPSTLDNFSLDDKPKDRNDSVRENYWIYYNDFTENLSPKKQKFINQLLVGFNDKHNNQAVSIRRNIGISTTDVLPSLLQSKFLSFNLLSESNSIGERELQEKFKAIAPKLRGSIYNLLAKAISEYEKNTYSNSYIDFSNWAYAIASAYVKLYVLKYEILNQMEGLAPFNAESIFKKAFLDRMDDLKSTTLNIKDNKLSDIIIYFLKAQPGLKWSGNYPQILEALYDFMVSNKYPLNLYPQSSNGLGLYLRKNCNIKYLAKHNVKAELGRKSLEGKQQRIIKLSMEDDKSI